jgi:hypothetical protein
MLTRRFAEILHEYTKKTGNTEYSDIQRSIEKINRLRMKIARANSLLILLSAGREPDDWKKQFERMFSTSEIKKVAIRLKNTKIELESAVTLHNRKMNSDSKKPVDSDYFINLEIALSKWLGYRIDERLVTVSEMAILQNNYSTYVKSLEKHGG